METKIRIAEFRYFIEQRLLNIELLKGDESVLFKKVLYVTFLDSLSASIYPKEENQKRFIKLLDNFSTWEDKDRICPEQLLQKLEVYENSGYEDMASICKPLTERWMTTDNGLHIISSNEAPQFRDVLPIASRCSFSEKELRNYKFSPLLYSLRNALVHNLQDRFSEYGDRHPPEPFYYIVSTFNENRRITPDSLELVFPLTFLQNLCKEVLESTIQYFESNNLNPFPRYYASKL